VVEATAPDHPVFPRKMMMTAGAFLAAIGAGIGGSFMYELASGRFQDADQVEGEIGLPVLGLFLRRNRAPHDMVVDEPLSLETEAVHAALTQILRTPPGEPARRGRTILVTSSLPHEGKSSFSVSLGRAAALAGHSVILLDCDLRRPAIARLLWSAGTPVRRDRMAVPVGPDGAGLLDMVLTDSKTPLRYLTLSSFFSKPRGLSTWGPFIDLWRQARTEYDIVLIDTPPVLATSEATELGSFADDVVMMVALQETPREAANESIRVLRRAGIAVRGTILSKVDLRRQTERGSLYFKAHAAYAQRLNHDEGT
jgi:Mrp family chromosome partitioning ATPase